MTTQILKKWVLIGFIGLIFSSPSYANNYLPLLPRDVLLELGKYNESNEEGGFKNLLGALRSCDGPNNQETEKEFYRQKVKRIEAIMEKYGKWIDLPNGKQIASFPTVQELGVELLGENPSYFKEKKYCPETYKEVVIHGKKIGMCPDWTTDRIIGENQGKKDSDLEILALLNETYKKAGFTSQFEDATREEWNYADTEGGRNPKLEAHANLSPSDPKFLGHFTPYYQISDKDPKDLTKLTDSREHQPRSIFANEENALGFRRAGQWEWVKDKDGSDRGLVGGSWYGNPEDVASGYVNSLWPSLRLSYIGPSRLVRIKK